MDFSLLQANTDNPTLSTVIYTMLLSFMLSVILAFTYEKTTRELVISKNYLQSLVLASIVAATVMQAIGDSLARGLGMLGALAIIRFRTTLRHPRNMMFMFASLAVGISCGVYGFNVAVVGTLTFCLVAVLLRFSPFSEVENMVGSLKFQMLEANALSEKEVRKIVKPFCSRISFQRIQNATKKDKTKAQVAEEGGGGGEEVVVTRALVEYEIQMVLKRKITELDFISKMRATENFENVRFSVRNIEAEY